MEWFAWFDRGPEVEKKEPPKPPEPWKVGEINPTVLGPLDDIAEVSSDAESSSASSTARERRRTIREIRSYVSENSRQDGSQLMIRSPPSSEDHHREGYRVAVSASDVSNATGVVYTVQSSRETQSASVENDDSEEQGNDEQADNDIDLALVEEYDHAFNEFIAAYPQFVVVSPDIVHSLRVCKLQKLLERNSTIEAELQDDLARIEKTKGRMEIAYQRELKVASRKKAAREVHLASKLAEAQKSATATEGKLLWQLVSTFEANAKKQHRHREQLKRVHVTSLRRSLLDALPKEASFQSIRDAMLVPPSSEPLGEEQKMDMQQFQIDNAFLHSEVAVLEKKLKHVKTAAKKYAWVESMLVRMDPKVLMALKEKFAKSKGIEL